MKWYKIKFNAEMSEDDVRAMNKYFYDTMEESMQISPCANLCIEEERTKPLKELIHDKINEVFLEMQEINNITDGGIEPLDVVRLDQLEDLLTELIKKVLNYQKGGIE